MRPTTAALLLLTLSACSSRAPVPNMVPDPVAANADVSVLPPGGEAHLDSLMGELTVREMAGQLVMPWLLGNYASFDERAFVQASEWVEQDEVGGILISVGSPLDVAAKLNELQRRSRLPLLVAADLEWGSGMRLRGGTTFPYPMAIGATGSEEDAYEMARVTAQEARAVGIHWTFSPVADLNNNPANPIINTRSFGEDPEAVSRLIGAYIRGATDNGLFSTAKHFPGHGDTGTDSHISIPVIRACWDRLDSLELVPFRAAVEAGVTSVMTAHIALPCFHPDNERLPATLSADFMTGVLRDSLGFDGIVVTDALVMGAIVNEYGPAEAAVRAFEAGSDMLLMPVDPAEAIGAMVAAVESGRISRSRLEASVRRILEMKVQAGLFATRTVDLEQVQRVVGTLEFAESARDIAERSLTLVREGAMNEFRETTADWALISYAEEGNLNVGTTIASGMRAGGNSVSSFRLYPSSGPLSYDSARTVIERNERVLFASSVRPISWRGHVALPDSLAHLIRAVSNQKPTLLVSLGSPYLLNQLPDFAGAFLLGWSSARVMETAIARAVSGTIAITGRSPITISSDIPLGFGLDLEVPDNRAPLPEDSPEALGFDGPALLGALNYLQSEVEAGSFPGAVLAVGRHGRVALRGAVGTYGTTDVRPVSDSTIYDLASLTKVIALTSAVAILVDQGKLDLDAPVQRYLPEFRGDRSDVTVRHLLTHSSGLPAWRPLYEETETAREARALALATPLDTVPGARYVYSDIGAIVLAAIVEEVTGEPFEEFVTDRVFDPIGMNETRFLPSSGLRRRIAPTEIDPWRGRLLRGEVHDENAHRLGGVSGHAGLFSTVHDLSRFAFHILGIYHRREPNAFVSHDVLVEFVTRQDIPDGSTRALGWDTPSAERSSAGTILSRNSFGHTGFTGTSIWIDPERDMFIILLTNRVHPTRENNEIRRVRRELADIVAGALR